MKHIRGFRTSFPRSVRRTSIIAICLAVSLFALLVPAAFAATVISDEDVVIGAGEIVEGNFYSFGGTTTVNGRVTGDLIAAGRLIIVGPDGVVEGDLMAAGAEVLIQGTVEGDVRAGGYLVKIADGGVVGGEFFAGGFSLEIDDGATVTGESRLGGYQALVDGKIGGDVWVGAGAMELGGAIDGDLRAYVDNSGEGGAMMFPFPGQPTLERVVDPGLRIAGDAAIGGDLLYLQWPGEDVLIPEASVAGAIRSETPRTADPSMSAAETERLKSGSPTVEWLLNVLRYAVALVLLGLLALWILPKLLEGASNRITNETGPSTLWGFFSHAGALLGFAMLLPVTLLLFLILGPLSLVGALWVPILSASFLTFAVLVFGMALLRWLARIAFAIWLGRMVLNRAAPNSRVKAWAALMFGATLYAALWKLPLIGWLLDLAAVIVAVGALLLALRFRWRGGTPLDAGLYDGGPHGESPVGAAAG